MSSLPKAEPLDGDHPSSSHVPVVEVVEMRNAAVCGHAQQNSGDSIPRDMSSLPKAEPLDGDHPSSSHVPVVEVVEMRNAAVCGHAQQNSGDSRGVGFKTGEEASQPGRNNQFRTQYDKSERERKVSKYQSKKKGRPCASSTFEESEAKIKAKSFTEDTAAPLEPSTESFIPDGSLMLTETMQTTYTSKDSKVKHETGSGGSGDHQYTTTVELGDLKGNEASSQKQLPHNMVGDREVCFEPSSEVDEEGNYEQSPETDEKDNCPFDEESQETGPQTWHGQYDGISDDAFSEGSSSDAEMDKELERSIMSSLQCQVKLTKLSSELTEGDLEWRKAGHVWRKSSSSDEHYEHSPTERMSPSAQTSDSGVASTSHAERKPPSLSNASRELWTRDKSLPVARGSQKSNSTVRNEMSPNSGQMRTISIKSPSRCSPISKQTSVSDTNSRAPSRQVIESTGRATTGSLELLKSMDSDSFLPAEVGQFSHSSSSLLSQLDGPSTQREILPSIQAAGHLGLSSHSETDWEMEEMVKMDTDEDDEDQDVLSLYEFDTFLESEDDQGERGHGTVKSTRGRETSLHLTPHNNLSISITDSSKRRVSRPSSNERNENKCQAGGQKDSRGTKMESCEENSPTLVDLKSQTRESQPPSTGTANEDRGPNSDHRFQKPDFPAPKSIKGSSKKSDSRPAKLGLLGEAPSLPPRGPADVKGDNYRQLQSRGRRGGNNRQVPRGPPAFQTAPLQRSQQHCLADIKKELETELKHFLEKKSIFEATETVSKIHQHESLKIDGGLVLNLLHLIIREGAVPQLMRIFSFVCNQGLFNTEVCNAYIRLGCAEGSRYDRQLKNIFQFLRRHGIQPAGDCIISLLRLYCGEQSEAEEDPLMFWLMLSYFDTFPAFRVPMPLLDWAMLRLLQRRDRGALAKFNQWVLTTKKEAVLQRMDLAMVGRLTVVLLPSSLSRLQKVIADAEEENPSDDMRKDLHSKVEHSKVDTTLVLPTDFSDRDYIFYASRIQECGGSENMDSLAQVYVELCRRRGHNRRLLKDYTQALVRQKSLVTAVDRFLHQLFDALQRERSQGDGLALAHLMALLLDHACFNQHADTTLGLLEVVLQCPLVVRTLMVNCGEVGCNLMALFLKQQQLSQALDLLKELQLRKSDEQGASLVKDLMRQLLAVGDIPGAFSALSLASSREAMGLADVGVLSSQLIWHSLEVGNVQVALEILELGQRQPPGPTAATPPLPPALLRAVLVASDQSGHEEKARALFQQLKRRRVYNAEPMGSSPHVFCLSTMLTPAEIRFCILDRLKELHSKLCSIVKAGQRLGSLERGLGVQVVGEHSPQALALPFLALAPRSCPQAMAVVTQELSRLDPPLLPIPHQLVMVDLVMVDPASLVAHLKSYNTPGLKQGLVWEDELPSPQPPTLPPQSKSSSSFQRPPPLPMSYQSGAVVGRRLSAPPSSPKPRKPTGRQLSVPTAVNKHPASKPKISVGRQSPVAQASAQRSFPSTQGLGDRALRESQPAFPSFPVPVDSVGRRFPVSQTAAATHLSSRPGDSAGRQGTLPPAQPPFHQPVSSVGKQAPGSANVRFLSSPGRRTFVPPSASRSEPPQQPRREMKRRLTAPALVPEHHQPAILHKTPLLPTPQLSPLLAQQGMKLSEPSSPKKMKASSPQGRRFLAGRPVEESRPPQQRQQRQHSSTSSPLDPQLPFSADTRQSQQSSPRGRGMAQPFSRNKYRGQFQGFGTRGRGNPSGRSRKGTGRMLSQSTQGRRGQSPQQTSQSFGQHLPQQFPGETRQMPISSTMRDIERAPAQSFQDSQSLPRQTSQHMGWSHPGEERSPLACHGEVKQFAKGPDFLPPQSTLHRNWQLSRQNAPSSMHSKQHFCAEVGELPNFPSRVDEQMLKSQAPMRQRVGTMEEGSERMDPSWQGSGSRHKPQQQQPRVEPWGDAPPPHEQGEDFSWRSRQLVEAAAQPFSLPAHSTGPFRQQDTYREPVRPRNPVGKSAQRGRGGPSFGSRPNWRRPFRGNFMKN